MKYYILNQSHNIKEMGVLPQSEEGYFGDIQQDFIPFEGSIDFNFKLPEPKLEKKANCTSLIDVAMLPSRFLIIDDLFLDLILKHRIGRHQYWKINTWQNQRLIKKYNLFIITETRQSEYIDFKKSIFRIGKYSDFTFKGDIIKIKDYNDYKQKKEILDKDRLWIKHEKTVYNLKNTTEDMFRTLFDGYFISEKLKNNIEKEKLTGIKFEEITNFRNRIEVIY